MINQLIKETNMSEHDTSWSMKWMRSVRKRAINILARVENDRKPTQELGYEIRKLHEAFTYWNSDIAGWEKTHTELPLKVVEQQEFLEENQVDISKD